ncbi:type I polyketide synthase, partial [Phytohabitans kaempferiae]
HTVLGQTLLPGTGYVELATRTGHEIGYPHLAELTLHAPLTLPPHGSATLQVAVTNPDNNGGRTVTIHSRDAHAHSDAPWIHHATGTLTAANGATAVGLTAWPPDDATAYDLTSAYPNLAAQGYQYGPAFQNLRRAWHHRGDLYAEVALAETAVDATTYGLHPALLDAALHVQLLDRAGGEADGPPPLPFIWSGVTIHAAGAQTIRVRISPAGPDAVSVTIADPSGAPVASIDSLVVRPATGLAGGASDSLFRLGWEAVPRPAPDGSAPDATVLTVPSTRGLDLPAEVHATAASVLASVRESLDTAGSDARLAVVTTGAVAAAEGDPIDPVAAAVWSLVRAAQAEHPGRFVLVDGDDPAGSLSAADLGAVLVTERAEIAVRGDAFLAPHLSRVAGPAADTRLGWDPDRTVLITGGTGGLGAVLARHLVTAHGMRRLLLTSRRGPDAAGARGLRDELAALGADVTIARCDVAVRGEVAALLAGIDERHPLVAVVHAAGVVDNGVIASMTADRLAAVLRPKVDGAWHLHELTQGPDLAAFVLFSSAAGVLLGAGQANYAAANGFLDALALHRRASGRPSVSLAWGAWTGAGGGMAAELDEAGLRRLHRLGMPPLSHAEGLALFDAALASGDPVLIPMKVDLSALRRLGGEVPAMLRALAGAGSGTGPSGRRPSSGSDGSLPRRLAATPAAERDDFLLGVVCARVAAVLGHASADAVPPARAFQELGFDSLAAIELRNQLGALAGQSLPATVVFDHPTPAALARYLMRLLDPGPADPTLPVLAELDRLEAALSTLDPAGAGQAKVAARLNALLRRWQDGGAADRPDEMAGHRLREADDDELFHILDHQLGIS